MDEHPQNIQYIEVILTVLKLLKSKFVNDSQFLKIWDIVGTFAVLKLLKSKLVKDEQR